MVERRRSTAPSSGVDVEAVVRHVLDSIEPFKPSYAQSCAIIDALRRALSSSAGSTNTDARDAGGA